jgi:hypothetical protein
MFPTPLRDQLNRFYCPLSAAYKVFDSKISGAKPFLPLTKGFLNGSLRWNLWRTASNCPQLRASSRFTRLTNVPKLSGYKFRSFTGYKFILALWELSYIWALSLLTLILLTWRLGWALNNASKWQMGFNSSFKGIKWSCLSVSTHSLIHGSSWKGFLHEILHLRTKKKLGAISGFLNISQF